jgi:hypothetical protein
VANHVAEVRRVCRAATTRFWLTLQEFVDTHTLPPAVMLAMAPAVHAAHPFVSITEEGTLAVRVPPVGRPDL